MLDRVVAPIAKQRPALLIVLDGMSHRVACELMEDVVARGWIELRPEERSTRTLVLSALPSVTGTHARACSPGSSQRAPPATRRRHFRHTPDCWRQALAVALRSCFTRAALKDPHGGLAADLRSEIAGERRVVAAVVNAIDDHLAKDDQLAAPWSATYIPILRLLLDEARNAGRMVVLASDHGHVLDHGGVGRDGGPEHGERYRSAVAAAGDGEQLVEGTRVLAHGGRCVLAVAEEIRYSPRKHGYHGGGSPQEVLAPLLVLAPGLTDSLAGWSETAYDPPAWWTGKPVIVPKPVLAPAVPIEEPGGQLKLTEPKLEPAPTWIADLLAADTFVAQRESASRTQVPDERLLAILAALDAAGGKLLQDALAQRVGIAPMRLRGTLGRDSAAAQRRRLPSPERRRGHGRRCARRAASSRAVRAGLRRVTLPSPQRRQEIVNALRRGTVPQRGLDAFAVGLDRLTPTMDDELRLVAGGGAQFKAVRGDYGSGKTFFSRWLCERAKATGFATSEVQISETETPLHRLETVYRRLVERLATADVQQGALRTVLERWGFALEEDVLASGKVAEHDEIELQRRVDELMEGRLAQVTRSAPPFATALRAHRAALASGDVALADGILSWIGAQPNVPAAVKRAAGVKGEIDHFGALSFLQGLLVVLRDAGHAGLVLVLDEIETLQRVRSDVREKSLNAHAPADRRDRRRPIPRPVRGDHRHPGVLRRAARRAATRAAGAAAPHRLLRRCAFRQPARGPDPAPELRLRASRRCRGPGARHLRRRARPTPIAF